MTIKKDYTKFHGGSPGVGVITMFYMVNVGTINSNNAYYGHVYDCPGIESVLFKVLIITFVHQANLVKVMLIMKLLENMSKL